MFRKSLTLILAFRDYLRLPSAAKLEYRRDRHGLPTSDPGPEVAIDEGIRWLGRAQDNSTSKDGGVARHFSIVRGWSSSYPETTGYIIPTMLAYAEKRSDRSVEKRAIRMLDWLVSIQLPEGGFQGGLIDSTPIVPVTFNTGQILLGLASGARRFGEKYHRAMCRAADWLVETQDSDGCWRRYPTPFAAPGEKAYETHVAWGLLEAARIEPGRGYADAAMANIRWALTLQNKNGWFDKCCLTNDPSSPLTHTLGYVLRGLLEAYRFSRDPDLLNASIKTAHGLLKAIRLPDGFLPGRLNKNWRGTVRWSCLTGTVQIAYCWLMLFKYTGDNPYREAALGANRYVRRSMKTHGPLESRGAIKGSFPVYGDYGAFEYLNWACKFFVDSNMLEKKLK